MQTVCQLDDDDTDVLRHGDKHLPQVLRLHLYLVGIEIQLGELGDPIYKGSHIRIEFLLHLLQGHPRIFYDIMKKPCCNRFLIHLQIGKDDGNAKRMNNIGFS